jgi:hypothetical protein
MLYAMTSVFSKLSECTLLSSAGGNFAGQLGHESAIRFFQCKRVVGTDFCAREGTHVEASAVGGRGVARCLLRRVARGGGDLCRVVSCRVQGQGQIVSRGWH